MILGRGKSCYIRQAALIAIMAQVSMYGLLAQFNQSNCCKV